MALELDLTTTDPTQRMMKRIGDLERRVKDLERQRFGVPMLSGSPSPLDGSPGSMAGDRSNVRLWVKIDSTWRYTTVT